MTGTEIQFVASFSPIVRDPKASRAFYQDALGLSFEGGEGDYVFTEQLDGMKHYGLWPLSEAAKACFDSEEWPSDVPTLRRVWSSRSPTSTPLPKTS